MSSYVIPDVSIFEAFYLKDHEFVETLGIFFPHSSQDGWPGVNEMDIADFFSSDPIFSFFLSSGCIFSHIRKMNGLKMKQRNRECETQPNLGCTFLDKLYIAELFFSPSRALES